jgi:hypothetical protein
LVVSCATPPSQHNTRAPLSNCAVSLFLTQRRIVRCKHWEVGGHTTLGCIPYLAFGVPSAEDTRRHQSRAADAVTAQWWPGFLQCTRFLPCATPSIQTPLDPPPSPLLPARLLRTNCTWVTGRDPEPANRHVLYCKSTFRRGGPEF